MKFEDLRQLMISDRSVRRFRPDHRIPIADLNRLVELCRYCPSGRNAQPLKYVLIADVEMCSRVFPILKWAGYFPEWPGPEEGERPAAYIIQCLDTHYGADCLCDDGLQLEAITLGLTTLGYGGCIIKAFDASALAEILSLHSRYKPRHVLALGVPLEKVVIEDMDGLQDSDFKYFRTSDAVHHVPKRPLAELILKSYPLHEAH